MPVIANLRLRFIGALYMPVLALAMALTMGRLLVFARVMSVEQFGAFNIALIVSTLTLTISCFGLFTNLQRKLPIDLQRGHINLGAARTALTLYGALAVGGVGLICAFAFSSAWALSPMLTMVGVVHGFSQQIFLIFTTETRSARQTMLYSAQILLRAFLIISIVVPVAFITGSAVLALLAEVVVTLIVSFVILRQILAKYRLSPRMALSSSVPMARKVNWPSMGYLVLMTLVVAASSSVDRWIAVNYLVTSDFAQYAFAIIIITVASSTQAMVNAALFPAIASRYTYSPRAAFRMAAKTSFGMLGLAVAICLPSVPILAWLVERFYPAYSEAIPLFLPITLAGVFRFADFWTSYLIVADRERRAVVINLIATLAPLALWLAFSTPTPLNIAYLALSVSAVAFLLSMFGTMYGKTSPHID